MVAGIAASSAVFVALYVVNALTYGNSRYPFVGNSLAKDTLFLALAVVGVGDIRRYAYTAVLLAGAHLALVFGMLLAFFADGASSVAGTLDLHGLIGSGTLIWIWMGADILIVVGLLVLYERAQRARYRLRYLSSVEFSTLMALAEILTPDPTNLVEPLAVATRVDNYLASFRASAKGAVRFALFGLAIYPLLTLHPPFSMMSPAARREFVNRRMLVDVWGRLIPKSLRTVVQAMIRAAQQLAFLGFYEDPAAQKQCGYQVFSERPGYADKIKHVDWDRPRVQCMGPRDVHSRVMTTDVAIVGSGAAGAVLAHELAAKEREVLILERGLHVDPSDFTEIESEQLSNLYADGALTLSTDFRFQILQGMCVGGSTVVNNGVCFEIPKRALAAWQDPHGLDAGLDAADLVHSFREVERLIGMRKLTHHDPLQRGFTKFESGIKELKMTDPPYGQGLFRCNINGCLGCGYCNIGCRFGKKLSMLETVLPKAQRDFPDAVKILAQCRVVRIEKSGGRALSLHCKLDGGRDLEVRANRFILSAGAVASSLILRRSGIRRDLAGRHLGFNAASPLTAEFDERLDATNGLQMTNYLIAANGREFALETWFNPLASQALFMPGWFHQHYENMLRYPYMTSVGAVVGTRRNATVKPGVLSEVSLNYNPAPEDFRRIVDGLKCAGRIMLAAGATRVMPASFRYMEARCERELERFDELKDNSDLSLNSAHPQGGNCLSRDPHKGVVDQNFAVHGMENVYVCDASVFPAPITVNPQLTVMALAHYAAQRIAAAPGACPAARMSPPRIPAAPANGADPSSITV